MAEALGEEASESQAEVELDFKFGPCFKESIKTSYFIGSRHPEVANSLNIVLRRLRQLFSFKYEVARQYFSAISQDTISIPTVSISYRYLFCSHLIDCSQYLECRCSNFDQALKLI